MEKQFLGGEIVHLVSEENDHWWAFEVLFCLEGPFERKIPKEFSLESCLGEGCTLSTKDISTRRRSQNSSSVSWLSLMKWVFVPISLLASENSYSARERVFVQNPPKRENDVEVCSVSCGHMLFPGLQDSHSLALCPYFAGLSPTWDWRGGVGGGRGMLTRVCSCS